MAEIHKDELQDYRWNKIAAQLSTGLLGLCLMYFAVISIGSSLDKPIPTGSDNELIRYAFSAIGISLTFLCGAVAVFLSTRFLRRMYAAHKAKVMAKEILERLSAAANKKPIRKEESIKSDALVRIARMEKSYW